LAQPWNVPTTALKEKEAVREKYNERQAVLLFNGDIHLSNNLVHLLKHFPF